MTGRTRVRFTIAEYLALLGAVADADTMAEERGLTPEERRNAAARDRAIGKVHGSLTEAEQAEVRRRLTPGAH